MASGAVEEELRVAVSAGGVDEGFAVGVVVAAGGDYAVEGGVEDVPAVAAVAAGGGVVEGLAEGADWSAGAVGEVEGDVAGGAGLVYDLAAEDEVVVAGRRESGGECCSRGCGRDSRDSDSSGGSAWRGGGVICGGG